MRFKQSQEEKSDNPGPGQYSDHVVTVNQKSKPAFAQERSDRKLLNHKEKSTQPGPVSYDIVSGMSMCSST